MNGYTACLRSASDIAEQFADAIIREQLVAPFNAEGLAYDQAVATIAAKFPDRDVTEGFDAGYVLGLAVGRRLAGGAR